MSRRGSQRDPLSRALRRKNGVRKSSEKSLTAQLKMTLSSKELGKAACALLPCPLSITHRQKQTEKEQKERKKKMK